MEVYTYIPMTLSRNRRPIKHHLFPVPCACAGVRRLARVLTRIYDDALRPSGLEFTQFGLLKTFELYPELTQSQLSDGLAFDSTTLTRTLSVIRRRGWIERRRGSDRRQWIFQLTDAGRARIEDANHRWDAAREEVDRLVGPGTAAQLIEMSNETVILLRQRPTRLSTGHPGVVSRPRGRKLA